MQTISAREGGGRVRHTCRLSYFQIYNEQLLDLLDAKADKQLTLSQGNQGMYVEGLRAHSVLNGAACASPTACLIAANVSGNGAELVSCS